MPVEVCRVKDKAELDSKLPPKRKGSLKKTLSSSSSGKSKAKLPKVKSNGVDIIVIDSDSDDQTSHKRRKS